MCVLLIHINKEKLYQDAKCNDCISLRFHISYTSLDYKASQFSLSHPYSEEYTTDSMN